jgi:hypothetical protein
VDIASLFARLGVKVDESSFQKGEKRLQGFAKAATGGMGKASAFVAGIAGKFAPIAAGLVGVQTVRDVLAFDEALTDLDINSNSAVGNLDEVSRAVYDVSNATGLAKEQVLSGAAAFTALTGDGAAAREGLLSFARVAKGSGAAMSDVAETAASMSTHFGVLPKDFEQAFSTLIAGGKAGSIELKDLAKEMRSLSVATRFGGGKGIEGLASTAAAMQLIGNSVGSASEATTAFTSLLSSLTSSSARLAKAGVQVFDVDKNGVKTYRNLQSIIEDIGESDLAKDPAALQKALGGSKESLDAYRALTSVKGAWADLSRETLHATDVATDYDKRQKSMSARADVAWTRVKNTVTSVFGEGLVAAVAFYDKLAASEDVFATVWEAIADSSAFWAKKALGYWVDQTQEFSNWALGELASIGEEAAEVAFNFIEGYDSPRNRAELRREGKVRGLKGRELDEFVGRGEQNQVTGNADAARAELAWRANYNKRSTLERAAYDVNQASKGVGPVTSNVAINVTTNASPEEIARVAKGAIDESWDARMRDLNEMTGGGEFVE